jgi:hypothetical protein
MERPIVTNIFGGPGLGKSTTSAGVFCLLKLHDIEVEYVDEFCKGLVWEERDFTFKNQLYLFTKQQHRIWRAADKVDVVVTDSPVLLSCVYRKEMSSDAFKQVVLETHNMHNNMNFLLTREKKYHTVGRNQTKEEAINLDNEIKEMLETYKVPYEVISGTYEATNKIAEKVLDKFGKELMFRLQKG